MTARNLQKINRLLKPVEVYPTEPHPTEPHQIASQRASTPLQEDLSNQEHHSPSTQSTPAPNHLYQVYSLERRYFL
jgi:hypothetical protein